MGPAHSIDTIVDYFKGIQAATPPSTHLQYEPGVGFAYEQDGTHVQLTFDDSGSAHLTSTFDSIVTSNGGTETHYVSDGSLISIETSGGTSNINSKIEIAKDLASRSAFSQDESTASPRVANIKIDSLAKNGEHVQYHNNSDESSDVVISAKIGGSGAILTRSIHVEKDLAGSYVTLTKENGSILSHYKITADGDIRNFYGSILHKDGSSSSSTSFFNSDGTGEFESFVDGYRGKFTINSKGDIIGNGEVRTDRGWYYSIEKWDIKNGKNNSSITLYENDGKVISTTYTEHDVASDIVISNNTILHSNSGISTDLNGKLLSVRKFGAGISFSDENGTIYSLGNTSISDNGYINYGGINSPVLQSFKTSNSTGISLSTGTSFVEYILGDDGGVQYTSSVGDETSFAQIDKNGLLSCLRTDGVGGGLLSGNNFSLYTNSERIQYNLSSGEIKHYDINHNFLFSETLNINGVSGNVFNNPDGSYGWISDNGQSITTYKADGSHTILNYFEYGSDEKSFDSGGKLISYKEIIDQQTHVHNYNSDGSSFDEIKYADGQRTVTLDDGIGNVDTKEYNLEGVIYRSSVVHSDHSGIWSTYDGTGTLNHVVYRAANGQYSDDYLMNGSTFHVLRNFDASFTMSVSGAANFEVIVGNWQSKSYLASSAVSFIVGAKGSDIVNLAATPAIIGFNKGDGNDIINVVSDVPQNNVLSLGKISSQQISIERVGDNLQLAFGSSDSILLNQWYSGKKSISTLQLVLDSTFESSFDPSNALASHKVATFDFSNLVGAYDQSRENGNQFDFKSELLLNLKGVYDTKAIGGDLSYYYAHGEDLSLLRLVAGSPITSGVSVDLIAQSIHNYGLVFDAGAMNL